MTSLDLAGPAGQADLEAAASHEPAACWCGRTSRRGFTALLAAAAAAPGAALASIPECERSIYTGAIPAGQVEGAAAQQYRQMLREADGQRMLAARDHPQALRLRFIADRIIPFAPACNERASRWQWEVNLIGSNEINAFCMPGGKIGFFLGILSRLQLDDDEVAAIMGHEAAHALLEHAREQIGKNFVTTGALRLGAAIFGLGDVGDIFAQIGGKLASLSFSRSDESQADALGLLMSAQAGYNPRAGISLWQKMMRVGGGTPIKLLSTHPTNEKRVAEIQARLPRMEPVFRAAAKPPRRFSPPARPAEGAAPASRR
ncbi:MAG: M48 family metallopeptidase [Rubrivivax sp.]|nr:M48 family metallopeptidase [Rubrivivax sp.]